MRERCIGILGLLPDGLHRLHAVAHAQLGVDRAQVELDRVRGDREVAGDLLVAHPGGEQRKDLALARAQCGERVVRLRGGRLPARGHHRAALEHVAQSEDRLLDRVGCQHDALGALLDRAANDSWCGQLAQQQDLQLGVGALDLRNRLGAGGGIVGIDDRGLGTQPAGAHCGVELAPARIDADHPASAFREHPGERLGNQRFGAADDRDPGLNQSPLAICAYRLAASTRLRTPSREYRARM